MRFNFITAVCITFGVILASCENDELPVEENNAINSVANIDNTVIHEWTTQLLALERHSSGRPNGSARALAYIYLAAYETAVPGMHTYVSNTTRLNGLSFDAQQFDPTIDFNLALNTCLSKVVDHFLLNVPADLNEGITDVEQSLESKFADQRSPAVISSSKSWGNYVADQIIAYSLTDIEAETQIKDPQPTSFEPAAGDGIWSYSAEPERALFPYWSSVRTFVISPEETSTEPPLSYSTDENSEYYKQMMDVYTANNLAKTGSGEGLWVAEFWSDDVEGLMMSPPARQVSIANQLIDDYKLNLEKSLELFLKLGFSLNDAAVATWKYKYDYMVMRPNVFIQDFIDPDYQTNLYRLVFWPNPSFPSYPSGHSSFASAAGGIFIDFFGDETNFTDRSHEGRTEFIGTPRTFTSFTTMAYENASSRVPLGVHMEMDCDEGLRLGYEIADAINDLPIKNTDK